LSQFALNWMNHPPIISIWVILYLALICMKPLESLTVSCLSVLRLQLPLLNVFHLPSVSSSFELIKCDIYLTHKIFKRTQYVTGFILYRQFSRQRWYSSLVYVYKPFMALWLSVNKGEKCKCYWVTYLQYNILGNWQ